MNKSLSSPQTWRELLGQLTERPAEKQRVADELGVNAFTVTRWINGETEPRARSLRKLPDVFPLHRKQLAELIQADFFPHTLAASLPPPDEHIQPEVPAELLVRVLAAYATTSGPFRSWSLRHLALQQAIEQLDPDQLGIEISVIRCVPPTQGNPVRSLCVRMGTGTFPWDRGIGWRLLFLGAESLPGWVVGRGEPGIVEDMTQKQGPLPLQADMHEKSAVAWPFQREAKVAGCLHVSSTQLDYFTPAHLSFIEIYTNALALSFRDEEFYELRQIALHEMPALSQQQEYTSLGQFRERVAQLRRTQAYRLSEAEAEVLALQQMETALLHTES